VQLPLSRPPVEPIGPVPEQMFQIFEIGAFAPLRWPPGAPGGQRVLRMRARRSDRTGSGTWMVNGDTRTGEVMVAYNRQRHGRQSGEERRRMAPRADPGTIPRAP